MSNRYSDWYAQAQRDLQQAQESRIAGHHEWACFASHQAAEKAAKALHLYSHQEAWGHNIARLLSDLPEKSAASRELIDKGRVLDSFYIPPRYPDSFPDGAPFEHFSTIQSEEALRYAGEIIRFVGTHLA